MRRSLVLAAAVASLTSCTHGRFAKGLKEYRLDEVVSLPESKIAEVSLRAGPVEVFEVRVRNGVTPQDLLEDTHHRDRSHPKPTVFARSSSPYTAWVTIATVLEDDIGTPLMTCASRKDQELEGMATEDWNACLAEGMFTRDWPRVQAMRVMLTVRVPEPPPAAE